MNRLIAIAVLVVLAFLLIRYGTNAKFQKWIVTALVSAFVIYVVTVVIAELIR